jgi:hypothetical protein
MPPNEVLRKITDSIREQHLRPALRDEAEESAQQSSLRRAVVGRRNHRSGHLGQL